MPWIGLDKYGRRLFDETVNEIEQGSDRACAIVAGSFVDEHLLEAIQTRLAHHDTVVDDMFKSSGPLGTFGSRIDLGFLVHLYGDDARKELNCVRRIRNEFAHKLATRDFSDPRMQDLANNLKLHETIEFHMSVTKKGLLDSGKFQLLLNDKPDGDRPSVPVIESMKNPSARQRYTRACKFFIAALSLAPHFPAGKTLF